MMPTYCLLLHIFVLISAMVYSFQLPKVHQNRSRRLNLTQIAFESRLTNATTLNDLSNKLGIASPWNAPKFIWAWAFKLQRFILPIVHFFDKCAPADTCFNLPVLWWKAIAGNDIFSKTYDRGVAFDLLPHITRWIVGFPFCLLYPRLHHQNIAMRTTYLDHIVRNELSSYQSNNNINTSSASLSDMSYSTLSNSHSSISSVGHTMVITLGAGFDTRSIRMASEYKNTSWFELDLPPVVQQKTSMFERFIQRRGAKARRLLPKLVEADLNNYTDVGNIIKRILHEETRNIPKEKRRVLFLAEASIMYLNKSLVSSLLHSFVTAAKNDIYTDNIRFCFADRFPVPCLSQIYSTNLSRSYGTSTASSVYISQFETQKMNELQEFREIISFLDNCGWRLFQWQVKPGRARHMGIAVAR